MLPFKKRMALLDKALSLHTAQTLYDKLASFEAVGPLIVKDVYNTAEEPSTDPEIKTGVIRGEYDR